MSDSNRISTLAPADAPTQIAQPPRRERIGISVNSPDALTLLDLIDEAEAAGVTQIWLTQNPLSLDALTIFAAAPVE